METLVQTFLAALGIWIPRIFAALVILLLGWIVAKILAIVTRRLLHWLKLDARLARGLEGVSEQPVSVEQLITQFVYYLVIFMAVLGALNALGMTEITALFSNMFTIVFAYLPRVIYALVLAVIAWFVARFLRNIVAGIAAPSGGGQAGQRAGGHGPGTHLLGHRRSSLLADVAAVPAGDPGRAGPDRHSGAHPGHARRASEHAAESAGGGGHRHCWPVRRAHPAEDRGVGSAGVRCGRAQRAGWAIEVPGQAESVRVDRLRRLHHRAHPGDHRGPERHRA